MRASGGGCEHVEPAYLAGSTSPQQFVVIDTIGRAPNGTLDDKRLSAEAGRQLGLG